MKQRYQYFRRENGIYYSLDTLTKKRQSLNTTDAATAQRLANALNEACKQPAVNLQSQERDPKYAVVLDCLKRRGWLEKGCIIFSQYYDSVQWLAEQLVNDLPGERIAIYAGSGKSGIWQDGRFTAVGREDIKLQVRRGEIRLLLGTDAASEGLNLQRLGTLINLDLPWNPTRLEQRKGRIQRIGQLSDTVYVYRHGADPLPYRI
jgi:superfamily II DNA/RNA helicase